MQDVEHNLAYQGDVDELLSAVRCEFVVVLALYLYSDSYSGLLEA